MLTSADGQQGLPQHPITLHLINYIQSPCGDWLTSVTASFSFAINEYDAHPGSETGDKDGKTNILKGSYKNK